MKMLITAATKMEIQPLMDGKESIKTGADIVFHTSGIGMMATTFSLAKAIEQHKPALVVQAGIAGCFDNTITFGSVVVVGKEYMADMGVTEHHQWKDVFDLNLSDSNEFPFSNKQLINPNIPEFNVLKSPVVTGVSVNTITTDQKHIQQILQHYHPYLESMEGAALHYVCLKNCIPFIQIRSISNLVGERDKKNWKLKESIISLNDYLTEYLSRF